MRKAGRLMAITLMTGVMLAMSLAAPAKAGGNNASQRGVKGGWVPTQVANVLAYQKMDGTFLTDGFTEDGYYVNKDGFWAPAWRILGAWVPSRNSFLTSDLMGEFEGTEKLVTEAQKKLTEDLHGWRVMSLFSDHITLYAVSQTGAKREKRPRISMYKNPAFNGYTIQIKTHLSGDEREMTGESGEWRSMATYDYQVLRLFLNFVSRSGDKAAKAIYSSWEDVNSYDLIVNSWVTVGDTQIRYVPSDGAGLYEIKAAF